MYFKTKTIDVQGNLFFVSYRYTLYKFYFFYLKKVSRAHPVYPLHLTLLPFFDVMRNLLILKGYYGKPHLLFTLGHSSKLNRIFRECIL